AGLADADDTTMPDAEIALDDADDGIDYQHVAEQEIERAFRAGDAGHADAVAQRLAAAMQAFVAIDRVILLDQRDQRGITKTNRVARGRAVKGGVITPVDHRHSCSPYCCA